ncbi:MAG: hypothetical protein Q8936_15815 [Bacillota bacterium]|nr:hypothetical protein [Bacillota bacterium]
MKKLASKMAVEHETKKRDISKKLKTKIDVEFAKDQDADKNIIKY